MSFVPAAVIPFRSSSVARQATWSLLEIALPGSQPKALGILLVDEQTGSLALRLRDEADFDDLDEQSHDYLAALTGDLEAKGLEAGGGRALLEALEDSLSGFLRIGERTSIEYSGDAGRMVNRLFDEHVDSEVRPFLTHLPLFGLRAAATRFGEEFEQSEVAEPEAWLRTPRGLRLSKGMFVAQVVGRSMEPLIPDGAYCVFRSPVVGSRQGKRLLIEQTGGHGTHGSGESNAPDTGGRYTVKRYTSRKSVSADGAWQHEVIRLEPLNPEFPAFELGEGEFRVIGEFVQVLES